MSDAPDPKKKRRGFVRSILTPRRPTLMTDTGLGMREEAALLARSLRETGRPCPNDGTPMVLENVFEQGPDGELLAEPTRSFICPTCEASIPIQDAIADISTQLGAIKRNEVSNQWGGIGIIIVFGILAYLTGNVITLVGGLLFGLTLIALSVFLRYRRWQIVNQRLFESTPPIRDFFADEFSK